MATTKINNIDFLNSIRTSCSEDYKNRIPTATKTNLSKIGQAITDYPNAKNEFIEVMTNLVGRTIFLAKLYENPFKFFKKGSLEYGKSIEAVFLDLISCKQFNENFGAGNNEASSLIATEKPKNVKVEYYSENFKHKYKISVSNEQLKGALRSENGLNDLMNKIIISPLSSAEYDEFLLVKKAVCKATLKEIEIINYSKLNRKDKSEELTTLIKTLINKYRFMNDGYNIQGVKTFCMPSEIVVLVTPETKAQIDVSLLSSAFNMEKADIEARLVMIDAFTKEDSAKNEIEDIDTLAIVCDESLVQFYETENTSESFRNPDTLTTHTFLHRWGIVSSCGFVNACKIKNKLQA